MPNTGMQKLAAFVAFAMILTASWNSMGAQADHPPGGGVLASASASR